MRTDETAGREANNQEYALGHSELELKRLILQAGILRHITERLLRDAGLREGMRVLDLGSGTGDVSMLAADIVGPSGSVVGIDRNQRTVELAQRRASEAGYSQVAFKVCPVEGLRDPAAFDFAVGRYVLVHQADPVEFVRAASQAVRPGGVIAFHENTPSIPARSYPPLELYDRLADLITAAAVSNLPSCDAALRAPTLFRAVGLPCPTLFSETPLGGGENSPIREWTADLHHSLRPQYEKAEIAVPESLDFRQNQGPPQGGSYSGPLPAHDANANLFLGAAPAGSQEAQYRMNAERRGCAFRVTGWLGFCGLRPSAGQPAARYSALTWNRN